MLYFGLMWRSGFGNENKGRNNFTCMPRRIALTVMLGRHPSSYIEGRQCQETQLLVTARRENTDQVFKMLLLGWDAWRVLQGEWLNMTQVTRDSRKTQEVLSKSHAHNCFHSTIHTAYQGRKTAHKLICISNLDSIQAKELVSIKDAQAQSFNQSLRCRLAIGYIAKLLHKPTRN